MKTKISKGNFFEKMKLETLKKDQMGGEKGKVSTMGKNRVNQFLLTTVLCLLAAGMSIIFGAGAKAGAATRKCYTISSGNTTVYSNTGLTRKYGTIFGSDEITVLDVRSRYTKVSYPISGGRSKTGYIATSAILRGTTGSSYKSRAKITTYKRPGGASYGYVAVNDTVTVLGTYGQYTQLKYPCSFGYKYAFITTTNANAYIYPKQPVVVNPTPVNPTPVNPAPVAKSTWRLSGNLLTVNGVSMSEYRVGSKYSNLRYANVNGKYVDMCGWQCCGYARYIQTKLFGCHDKNSSKFKNVSGYIAPGKLTASYLKSKIQSAGVGAHIRTSGSEHSLAVIGITNSGFTIADANSDGKLTVRVCTYTWSSYVSCKYGKRGLSYIKKYVG